jgi:cis-3-alkyl-4-acyloxetan-2-one decarboxylase
VVTPYYPFASHSLEIDGHRCHYLDEGTGDPIVMLHGNPTWSYYYRNMVAASRCSYRTIVPDHIGCGLSDKPSAADYPYTLERRVRDLETLLNSLRLVKDLTLVLHDWGGMIGMAYAHRHPDAIRRLVILNTGAFHLPASKPFPWSLWLCRNRLFGSVLVRGLNAFCRGAARYCTIKGMTPEIRAGYLAPYDSWANRVAVLRFVQDIPLRPSDPGYQLISDVQANLTQFRSLPMLICWGEKDFVFDGHFLAEWQRYFPEAEVHRFPNAGHYVLEDAGDEIIALVQTFLKAHPLTP